MWKKGREGGKGEQKEREREGNGERWTTEGGEGRKSKTTLGKADVLYTEL